MKKRVLIFSSAYLPLIGGAEVAIKEITDRLGSAQNGELIDWEFEMITAKLDSSLADTEMIGNVLVHRLGKGNSKDKIWVAFFGIFKVIKLMREKRFDIFWSVQATYTSGPCYLYNILNFRNKVPIILTLQEGELESKKRFGIVNFCWRLALARTQYLTAISEYLRKRAISYGYKGKVRVIPNGVGEQFFKIIKKKHKDIVLVTTSRLVEKNAVSDIIKSLAYLPNNIKFLVIGTGELEAELKTLAKGYRVDDRIIWQGAVPNQELPKYLGISDIFVRPSLSEGLGISFLEAMAGGLPVIATPVGGIPDFLKDPSTSSGQVATGLFCEPRNPASIAECVKRLIANDALCKDLIKNAKKLVADKFVWTKIVKNMSEVFDEAIKLQT